MSNKLKGIIHEPKNVKATIQEDKAIQVSVKSGARGKSAYEVWLDEGNTGTKQDFLDSLRGKDGTGGSGTGSGSNGLDGLDGLDGKSAYEIWLELGNIGTEDDFISSLKGDKGIDGRNGTNGLDGSDGNNGIDGESAYEVAVRLGFIGTEIDWRDSLKGDRGLDGKQGIQGDTGLTGKKGLDGINGTNGIDGKDGAKGEKGDPFIYEDFTPEQLLSLKGDKGDKGEKGLNGLAGKDGINGIDGKDGKDAIGNGIELTNHIDNKVHLGEAHGMRLNVDKKLEYFDGIDWIEVKGGGYPVAAISNVGAKGIDMAVALTWEDPEDVVIDTVPIAKWKSTKVMRKVGSYPIHENDGELVVSNGVRNQYKTEPFIDEGLVNEQEYFYSLFPETEDGIVTISESSRKLGIPVKAIIIPGSKEFLGGNETAGYMGTVAATELFTGTELSSLCGISQGTAQHNNSAWLKFMIDGKVIFKSQLGFRHTIAYKTLLDAGCVNGEKVVTKQGTKYKVRLMNGVGTYVEGQDNGDVLHYSEWNRLMLPILNKSSNNSWKYPTNVEEDLPHWGEFFAENHFGINQWTWSNGAVLIDGSYHLCRDDIYNEYSIAARGGEGVEGARITNKGTYADPRSAWSPVLEVVTE